MDRELPKVACQPLEVGDCSSALSLSLELGRGRRAGKEIRPQADPA